MDILVSVQGYKAWATEQFARGGGARKTHKGQASRGHKGNCDCRRPGCSLCHCSGSEYRKLVGRKSVFVSDFVD